MTITTELANKLNLLNRNFYAQAGTSFSSTRKSAWPGWNNCIQTVLDLIPSSSGLSLLDLACGNLRFENWIGQAYPDLIGRALAVDSSLQAAIDALSKTDSFAHIQIELIELDIIQKLLNSSKDNGHPNIPELNFGIDFDIAACFGFFHHIPGDALRRQMLRTICELTAPGGFVLLSLWDFMSDEKLSKKAIQTSEIARLELGIHEDCLENGDYFFAWQDKSKLFRYCHSFSEQECHKLASEVQDMAKTVEIFESDGRNGKLNRYLILRKTLRKTLC